MFHRMQILVDISRYEVIRYKIENILKGSLSIQIFLFVTVLWIKTKQFDPEIYIQADRSRNSHVYKFREHSTINNFY